MPAVRRLCLYPSHIWHIQGEMLYKLNMTCQMDCHTLTGSSSVFEYSVADQHKDE